MVAKSENIFCATRKMVPALRNIFSFEKTMVWVIHTLFPTTWTKVTTAQKVVSVTPTIVCRHKLLGPGFVCSETKNQREVEVLKSAG
jgi:hypothetical protein